MTPSSSSASLNALALIDRVLAGHAVDHQVDLLRLDAAIDLPQLLHQLFVDVQSAGRVEDDDAGLQLLGLPNRVAADGHRVFGARLGIDVDVELLADDVQLFDGRGALQVGRHQQRLARPVP